MCMKIACFHNFLTEERGAELAFKNMAIGLAKIGHNSEVHAFDISQEFKNEFVAHGIKFFSYNFKKERAKVLKRKLLYFLKYVLQYLFTIKKISKKINLENYDVVLVSHWYSAMIIPGLNKPVLYYCQEPPRHVYEFDPGGFGELLTSDDERLCKIIEKRVLDRLLNFITKYMDLWCGRKAEIIVGNSEYSKSLLQKIYKKPVLKVYLGVDTGVFKDNQSEKQNFILSIGPLCFFKGHDFVINGLALLPPSKRPALIIVGSGSSTDRQYLLELGNRLNVKVDIKSGMSTGELVGLYNSALATVCAFVREPFGLVAIESMACSTPVIAVKEGGLIETVNNDRGILIRRDPKELAEAIALLEDSPRLAKEFGKKGSEFVSKNFSWELCCENLEKALIKLTKRVC
ncbi:MAG: glycosyltransferase family 4 protein [Candidatus Thermoplasmatota archaeon]|nr:glycosyltransferase family 4 protein [Candidatus Thermoplasmatota archaeon]